MSTLEIPYVEGKEKGVGDYFEAWEECRLFLCPKKKKEVSEEFCLAKFRDANAFRRSRSVCANCAMGRRVRWTFAEGPASTTPTEFIR